ncbi:MAG: hypothetical protein LZ162_06205 [Thaumarchaeota archaeon]|nr:hypothetical protein [Candidatus Terraquivivens yellowstonensis]
MPFLKCDAFVDVEDDYQELEPVRGFIEIEVMDRGGQVIQRGRHEMHSFVNNFLKVLEGEMRAGGGATVSLSVTAIDGTSKTILTEWGGTYAVYGGGTTMALKAPDDDSSYGIVVGSGTTPVNLNSYALASPISHGTGAGQLDYDAVTLEDLGLDTSVSPPVYRLRISRGFKNLSGGDVNINEVGLIARNYWKHRDALQNDVKFLIARDVLPSTYTVPNGGSAVVAVIVEVVMG